VPVRGESWSKLIDYRVDRSAHRLLLTAIFWVPRVRLMTNFNTNDEQEKNDRIQLLDLGWLDKMGFVLEKMSRLYFSLITLFPLDPPNPSFSTMCFTHFTL